MTLHKVFRGLLLGVTASLASLPSLPSLAWAKNPSTGSAQAFPERPVRIIVPYVPGGSTGQGQQYQGGVVRFQYRTRHSGLDPESSSYPAPKTQNMMYL